MLNYQRVTKNICFRKSDRAPQKCSPSWSWSNRSRSLPGWGPRASSAGPRCPSNVPGTGPRRCSAGNLTAWDYPRARLVENVRTPRCRRSWGRHLATWRSLRKAGEGWKSLEEHDDAHEILKGMLNYEKCRRKSLMFLLISYLSFKVFHQQMAAGIMHCCDISKTD